MSYCSRCGARVSSRENFCPECGAPLRNGQPPRSIPKKPKVSYEIKRCCSCRGTGSGRLGGICPVCKGRGEVKIRKPVRRCLACNQTGMGNLGGFCPVCKGTGWVTL